MTDWKVLEQETLPVDVAKQPYERPLPVDEDNGTQARSIHCIRQSRWAVTEVR